MAFRGGAGRGGSRLDEGQIDRRAAAPAEGVAIELDGDAVQFDRPVDRRGRDRHEPLLIGVAATNSAAPAPTAATMPWRRSPAGKGRSGLRVKSPVIVSWLLMIARVWPAYARDSASAPAETTRSQPSSRCALPAAIRTAWMSSGRSAMRTWLRTAPPFW